MNAPQVPSLDGIQVSTPVGIPATTCAEALRKGLVMTAHARGDITFSIYREAQMLVRRDRHLLLDQFAQRPDWACLRPGYHTLIIRSEGLFGTIRAYGEPDYCDVEIELWTDTPERGDACLERILTELRPFQITDVAFSLSWRFLDGKGEVSRASTKERASEVLLNEAYPSLPDVDAFIEDFLDSTETVLVLQGAPGTGKTRLIRSILGSISRRKGETTDVLYTGDSAVLESDTVFLEFITGSFSAFVVEDADHLLAPRCGGNNILHRFLNIADGIASAHGKKIIFSTNLPNMRDIDEAPVRPGRCFAHLYLEELQPQEAVRLLERLFEQNPERRPGALADLDPAGRKAFSVAEVYSAFRRAGPQSVRMAFPRRGVAPAADRVAFGFN
jgi:hypothetical protein